MFIGQGFMEITIRLEHFSEEIILQTAVIW